MLGSNAVERSQVDQWISFTNSTIDPTATTVSNGIFGWADVMQDTWNEASKNLKAHMKVMNTALEGKKFLVGNEMTVADVVAACSLLLNF